MHLCTRFYCRYLRDIQSTWKTLAIFRSSGNSIYWDVPCDCHYTAQETRIRWHALEVKNYRPVSNLSFMSKVIEKLVCQQLVRFLKKNILLPKCQSTYRRNNSIQTFFDNYIRGAFGSRKSRRDAPWLVCQICRRLSTQSTTTSYSIDFVCLYPGSAPSPAIGGKSSLPTARYPKRCCVPRGSDLGSFLFLLYTADMARIVEIHAINFQSFADDSELYLHSKVAETLLTLPRVVSCSDVIDRWMSSNRLKLNVLGSRRQLAKYTSWRPRHISLLQKVTCLGVTLMQDWR